MNFCLSLLIALCLDRLFGWPEFIFRRFSHPVVGFGHLISLFESKLNKSTWSSGIRKATGVFSLFFLLTSFAALSFLILLVIPEGPIGVLATSFLVWPLIAAKSLADHVAAVAEPLKANDLPEARQAVSMIVGRNSNQLGSNDIARAALESLAENTSDGVTAPLFWGVLLGFPGVLIYKFVNTADSMIGYKNERYEQFGKFAAKLDDVLNFIPARLTAILMLIITGKIHLIGKVFHEGTKHSSPNAGYPEAALAFILDCRFGGPNYYHGKLVDKPYIGDNDRIIENSEFKKVATINHTTTLLCVICILVLQYISVL